MKPMKNMMQQRMNAAGGNAPAENAGTDPEFDALVDEISALIQKGKLPEGFDLESAARDPKLAELMREYGAEAGIRIYTAEQRAEEAENSAMERVSARVRNAARPKSTRGGGAAPAATNYRGMSSDAFRALMQQMKSTARDGGKTRL
ncbi:MAG: hypothetical protein R2912_04895 [Eubacteriales bacterium]